MGIPAGHAGARAGVTLPNSGHDARRSGGFGAVLVDSQPSAAMAPARQRARGAVGAGGPADEDELPGFQAGPAGVASPLPGSVLPEPILSNLPAQELMDAGGGEATGGDSGTMAVVAGDGELPPGLPSSGGDGSEGRGRLDGAQAGLVRGGPGKAPAGLPGGRAHDAAAAAAELPSGSPGPAVDLLQPERRAARPPHGSGPAGAGAVPERGGSGQGGVRASAQPGETVQRAGPAEAAPTRPADLAIRLDPAGRLLSLGVRDAALAGRLAATADQLRGELVLVGTEVDAIEVAPLGAAAAGRGDAAGLQAGRGVGLAADAAWPGAGGPAPGDGAAAADGAGADGADGANGRPGGDDGGAAAEAPGVPDGLAQAAGDPAQVAGDAAAAGRRALAAGPVAEAAAAAAGDGQAAAGDGDDGGAGDADGRGSDRGSAGPGAGPDSRPGWGTGSGAWGGSPGAAALLMRLPVASRPARSDAGPGAAGSAGAAAGTGPQAAGTAAARVRRIDIHV